MRYQCSAASPWARIFCSPCRNVMTARDSMHPKLGVHVTLRCPSPLISGQIVPYRITFGLAVRDDPAGSFNNSSHVCAIAGGADGPWPALYVSFPKLTTVIAGTTGLS